MKLQEYCEFPLIQEQRQEPEYIGLKIQQNENQDFHFIFPVNYYTKEELEERINCEDLLKKDMVNLLKAIYETNVSEIYQNGKTSNNICPIDAYLWILQDYLENGYYIEKEISYSQNTKGKVDWKRTMKKNEYLVDGSGNIIYTKMIKKVSRNNLNSLITQIHKYCVKESAKLSFLMKIYQNPKDFEDGQGLPSLEVMISILKKELANSFLDQKKLLLSKMLQILEWKNDGKTSYQLFSIQKEKFELVFEKLIDEHFGNVGNKQEYYPYAKWHIQNSKKEEEGYVLQSLREDTILQKENAIYILDAKYYKYAYFGMLENPKALPPTSSVEKQIIYGEFVDKKFGHKIPVYNVFLIPANEPKYLKYIGYADTNWREEGKTYDKIYTFQIDLKSLVNRAYSKAESQSALIKKLEKVKKA